MKPSLYKRLPGHGWSWTGPSRVWLGEDHVLLVISRVFLEFYRRFFLKDIQAVIVRRTNTAHIWSGVLALGFAFFAGIALLVDNRVAQLVFAGLALPFAVALAVNVALGPTCACYIRTAVQTERLLAVSRLSTARKFIARIEPLVIAAQGELDAGQFTADIASIQTASTPATIHAPPVFPS